MKSLRLLAPYKSLSNLYWDDIPSLAIVTGLNGVGKTQFLSLLAAELDAAPLDDAYFLPHPPMELEPRPTSVGYLPALWQHAKIKISHEFFEPANRMLYELADRPFNTGTLDERLQALKHAIFLAKTPIATRIIDTLHRSGNLTLPLSRAQILATLDTYDLVTRDLAQPLTTLAQIFYAHANARITAFLRNDSQEQVDTLRENSPLEKANHLLRDFDMNFQLIGPDDLRFTYELRCHVPENGAIISTNELSSGEQAVLALVALVVTMSVLGAAPDTTDQNPELLLLDEPDSHLNTSKVKSYLEHVQQLTARGVQIIMVTHRPDTIALAPHDSLFEMRHDNSRTTITKGPRMEKSIEHGSVRRAGDRHDLADVIYVCSGPPYRAREVGPRKVADVEANAR